MCELFAMSSRFAANVTLSLGELARHGGLTGIHADGWGITWFGGRDALTIREPVPAAQSEWLRALEARPIASRTVISHIRKATQGAVALRNTQPFTREWGARWHAFAHNGDLHLGQDPTRALPLPAADSAPCRPVGETDSERAFCALLAALKPLWRGSELPDLHERLAVVTTIARQLRALGPANFLYSDGDALFVHADRRSHGGDDIRPPGLHVLHRSCDKEVQASPNPHCLRIEPAPEPTVDPTVPCAERHNDVLLIASVPLSDESWEPLPRGTVLAVQRGREVARTDDPVDTIWPPKAAPDLPESA